MGGERANELEVQGLNGGLASARALLGRRPSIVLAATADLAAPSQFAPLTTRGAN
jgi:hypothetical protein